MGLLNPAFGYGIVSVVSYAAEPNTVNWKASTRELSDLSQQNDAGSDSRGKNIACVAERGRARVSGCAAYPMWWAAAPKRGMKRGFGVGVGIGIGGWEVGGMGSC